MSHPIQRGDMIQALRRRYGLVGETRLRLLEDVVPVVKIDELSPLTTPLAVMGSVNRSPTAAAADDAIFDVFLDADVNVLMRIRKVDLYATGSEKPFTIGWPAAGLGAGSVNGTTAFEDNRLRARTPAGMIRGNTAAPSPAFADVVYNGRLVGAQGNFFRYEPEAMFLPPQAPGAVFDDRLYVVVGQPAVAEDFSAILNVEWEELPLGTA